MSSSTKDVNVKVGQRLAWHLTCLLLFGLTFVPFCSLVAQDSGYTPPDQVQVKTPVYSPEFSKFDPPLGTYTYNVSWQGISAAEAKVTVAQQGESYLISTSARTYSGIDLFYKLRFQADGVISALDLLPRSSTVQQQENSRIRRTSLLFHPDGTIESLRTERGRDDESLQFNPNNITLDPFSAAFLARSLDWKLGDTKDFDTFNGKSRYLISLKASELLKLNVNGEMRDVWVIEPKVINLTKPEQTTKLRSAKIYVTADSRREVLQIASSVFIGTVTTELTGFEPLPAPPPETRIALQRMRDESAARIEGQGGSRHNS